jgi:site-specific recombinase XerD
MDAFTETLSRQGFSRSSIREQIRLVGALSRWMTRRGIDLENLDEVKMFKFLQDRSRSRRIHNGDEATLRRLLQFLCRAGIIPDPSPKIRDTLRHRLEKEFAQYLVQERGLAQSSVVNYLVEIRCFLSDCEDRGIIQPTRFCSQDVTQFILRRANTASPRRAQLTVCALRVFFRFLLQRGEIQINLAAAVPTVANWRFSTTPKFLEPEDVERLLLSCDRRTPVGRRNYAILLLLVRLGLRVGEVTQMVLEDIDWGAGEILVHGKGARQDRLPIPKDVGEAVAAYLRCDRPHCPSRRVFILLRHSLATKMLRRGFSLPEIGQILRHQQMSTTQIYAKVDLAALRTLAQPWPGGAR